MIHEPAHRKAMITGASAGIGAAYARRLAAHGYALIVTARRQERLQALAAELQNQQTSIEVHPADLSERADVKQLEALIRSDSKLSLLINCAGFGISGSYLEQPVERHQRMLDVHLSATVRLTHAALPGMIRRGRGRIINVSSVAAFVPVAGGPGYSASKAYLNVFSTNLESALTGTGVHVQALCPGYTYTEFHRSADYQGNEQSALPGWLWMTAEEVVDYSLKKLDSKQVIVIPGFKNRLIAFFLKSRIAPPLMSLRKYLLTEGK